MFGREIYWRESIAISEFVGIRSDRKPVRYIYKFGNSTIH